MSPVVERERPRSEPGIDPDGREHDQQHAIFPLQRSGRLQGRPTSVRVALHTPCWRRNAEAGQALSPSVVQPRSRNLDVITSSMVRSPHGKARLGLAVEPSGGRWREHIHGWLLLLPAAVLLVAFTHYPVVATLYESLFSTPRPSRPSVWVGLDNYRALSEDPVFWQALRNNVWFALGTIPLSMGLAVLMAVWVNGRIPGRALLRLSFFTPTVLPMIAVANIWLFFYTPGYGLLEQLTGLLGFA